MHSTFATHLLRTADPLIRLDGLSPAELEQEAQQLALFAVEQLQEKTYVLPALLVHILDDRQRAQYVAHLRQVEDFGQWRQDISSDGASYFPPQHNPYAIGDIRCENCVHWQEGKCEIVAGAIEAQGVCRLWIIPDDVLSPFENEYPYRQDSVRTDDRVIKWNGLEIGVTHEPGMQRFMGGNPMRAYYGRLYRSWGQAEDGKAIDVYLAPDFDSASDQNPIHRVTQRDPETGMVNERKLFLGYPTSQAVKQAHIYHAGAERFGFVEPVNPTELDAYRKDVAYHADSCGCEACSGRRTRKKKRRAETEESPREDADRRGLVAKKVKVKGKGGKVYESTRWVKPEDAKTIAVVGAGLLGAGAIGAGAIALSQSGKGSGAPAGQPPAPQPSKPKIVADHPNPIEEVNDQDFPYSMVIWVGGSERKQEQIQEFLDALENPKQPEASRKLANLVTEFAFVHKGKIPAKQKALFAAEKQVPANEENEYDSQFIYLGLSKKPNYTEYTKETLLLDHQDFFVHELPTIIGKAVVSPRIAPETSAGFYKKDNSSDAERSDDRRTWVDDPSVRHGGYWRRIRDGRQRSTVSPFVSQQELSQLRPVQAANFQAGFYRSQFVASANGQRFLYKTNGSLVHAREVLASDLAQSAGINANLVRLIPWGTTGPIKPERDRSGTLHDVVPGLPVAALRGTDPRWDDLQMMLGLDEDRILRSAVSHPDLAEMLALDLFTGNSDRHSRNFLFDANENHFYAIDLGEAFADDVVTDDFASKLEAMSDHEIRAIVKVNLKQPIAAPSDELRNHKSSLHSPLNTPHNPCLSVGID